MSKTVFSSIGAYFGLVARQMNASSRQVSLTLHSGVIPGGFSYSAFNGAAKVRPEAILSVVETTRGLVFNKFLHSDISFLDADKIYQNYFMFINAASLQIDEKLYDPSICKGPLHFDVELEHIGKTSSRLKTSFYLEDVSSDPVIVSRVSTVLVCSETRTPKSPPDWWVEKYKNRISGGNKPAERLEFSGGDVSRTTEAQFKILLSDVDTYRHTNWSNYIKYCHEAFGQRQISELGSDGFTQFFRRGIKDFSILYRKETSVDEILTVKVSPDISSDAENTFYFSIENESKDVVCQSKIEYYPLSQ